MAGAIHLDEGMLRRLVNMSAAAILLTDTEGAIQFVNRRFTEITGYQGSDVIGQSPAILNSGHTPKAMHQELWKCLREGRAWRGRILNRKKSGEFYWAVQSITPILDESGCTSQYLSMSDDASEIIALAANEDEYSFYDEFTGVGNRRLFDLDLAAELAKVAESSMTLGLIELNNTELNDALLTVTASRIISLLGHSGSAYRLSERRFAVLLTASPRSAHEFSLKAPSALSAPLDYVFDTVYPQVCIGYAALLPSLREPRELVLQAEQALMRIPRGGSNHSQWVDTPPCLPPSNSLEQLDDRTLFEALQLALDDGDFRLAAQPILQLDDGRLAALEFLLRWQHPQYGDISPLRVIEVAEKFGYLYPVAEQVMRLMLASLSEELIANGQVSFSVNFNLPQITNRRLVQAMLGLIDAAGIERSRFIFEVTETDELTIDPSDASDTFSWIRREGVVLALDDFGSGYSTLDYLSRFQMDLVKFDRSLVKDIHKNPRRQLTLKKMLELCQGLGVAVVIEGIETAEEHNTLLDMGISHLLVQGYYYGLPRLLGSQGTPLKQMDTNSNRLWKTQDYA